MKGGAWVAPSSQQLVQHLHYPQLVQATLISHLDHCSSLLPTLPVATPTHCRLVATQSQGGPGRRVFLSPNPPGLHFIQARATAASQALCTLPLLPLLLTPSPSHTGLPAAPRPCQHTPPPGPLHLLCPLPASLLPQSTGLVPHFLPVAAQMPGHP